MLCSSVGWAGSPVAHQVSTGDQAHQGLQDSLGLRVGKLQTRAHNWPAACFHRACVISFFFCLFVLNFEVVGKKSEEEYYFVMCENHRKWKFVSITSCIRAQPCSFACVSFITPVAAFTEMAVLSSWDGHHSVCPANPTVLHLALHRESPLTSVSEPPISPADPSPCFPHGNLSSSTLQLPLQRQHTPDAVAPSLGCQVDLGAGGEHRAGSGEVSAQLFAIIFRLRLSRLAAFQL